MGDFIDDHLGALILTGCVLLFGFLLWATYEDQMQWDAYAKVHHCAVVGTKQGQTVTGFSSDGKGTVVVSRTPDQTIYKCDDGEIEIR